MNPEAALFVGRQTDDRTAGKGLGIGVIEQAKTHAIESHQTLLAADPEVAIWGLRHRIHGARWETALTSPAIADILIEEPVGIQRLRCGNDDKHRAERHERLTADTRIVQPPPRWTRWRAHRRSETCNGSCVPIRCLAAARRM